jgi:hypothetical protein
MDTPESPSQPFTPKFHILPYENGDKIGYSKIVSTPSFLWHSGRKMVVANIRGHRVPFYLSTGAAGKDSGDESDPNSVPSGKWYAHGGIGEDNWINKTNAWDMKNSFGSKHIHEVKQWLDRNVGDIREDDSVPEFKSNSVTTKAINSGLDPAKFTQDDEAMTVANTREELIKTTRLYGNIFNLLTRVHREPKLPTQQERIQDSGEHMNLLAHAKANPDKNLGTSLP